MESYSYNLSRLAFFTRHEEEPSRLCVSVVPLLFFFFFFAESCFTVQLYHSACDHSHFEEHRDSFRFRPSMNKAAMYICGEGLCKHKFHFSAINIQECDCWVLW